MRRLTSDCLGGGLVCDDACLGLLALKMMARDHPGFVGTQMTASLKGRGAAFVGVGSKVASYLTT